MPWNSEFKKRGHFLRMLIVLSCFLQILIQEVHLGVTQMRMMHSPDSCLEQSAKN